ncbi:MAG: dihydrodipicolinate synthase family protein [Rhizobiales bacterium]|nr:dihydrodipicolinate synthase family protein [Hyphomicrobiales bacterium]NRB14294.1 dihydrodipicolinate synthase family protein [Hyphomicrobiales bacterium]
MASPTSHTPIDTEKAPKGIWGSVLLPIDNSGSINWQDFEEQVEILCASNLAGIYTNGTAGEFYNQTEAEFEKVTGIVAEAAKKQGKPFQIGVSNSNPRIARNRFAQVAALSPDAVQITLPDWWPPSWAEIERFVDGMQEVAGQTPIILYNPPHAKVRLDLHQIDVLQKRIPNLVGVKLAAGDKCWYSDLQNLHPNLSVFVPGHKVAFGRPLGADGSYSNVACISPEGATRHWQMIETDLDAAIELEARINEFFEQYVFPLARTKTLSDPALDKLLAAIGQWGPIGPRLLWPYDGASIDDVQTLASAVRRALPELF